MKKARYYSIILLCLTIFISSISSEESVLFDTEQNTCRANELNHSVLVECNATSCGQPEDGSQLSLRPKSFSKILHVFSTRAGARLAQVDLPNLDHVEDSTTKLFNINTTLTVLFKNSKRPKRNELLGFGGTLDLARLSTGNLEQSHGLILDDLFSEWQTTGAARLNFLRLTVDTSKTKDLNLSKILFEIDQHIAHLRNYNTQIDPLKLVLDLRTTSTSDQATDGRAGLFETLRNVSVALDNLSSIVIWAVALEQPIVISMLGPNSDHYEFIKKSLPSAMILASVSIESAPGLVDKHLASAPATQMIQGLLLEAQQAVPYNSLEYLSNRKQINIILSVASKRPKPLYYGDWQNAEIFATEISKHLRHGSMAFIENLSAADVLMKDVPDQDSSLYNLHMSHKLHFKGPMFYALAHFSRYLPPGSEPLETSLFTQPNMFAADYSAFKTKDNHVVAVILNSNDHLLPFRLELDTRIMLHTYLEPKSFNTIIIKV